MEALAPRAPETPEVGPLGWLGWRPLLLVCLALVTGVAVADRLPHTVASAATCAAVAALAGLMAWFAGRWAGGGGGPRTPLRHTGPSRRPPRHWRRVADAALLAAAFAAGALSYDARLIRPADDLSRCAPCRVSSLVVRIASADPTSYGTRAVGRAESLTLSRGTTMHVTGKVYITAYGSTLRVGELVRLDKGMLRPWRHQTNPFQRLTGLYWQRTRVWCHIHPRGITVLEASGRPTLADLAASCRDALNQRLALAMPGRQSGQYAAEVAAIVYGGSLDDLPQPVVDLYRRTGTIHVLVVSGSQVTILVLVLMAMTGSWRRHSRLAQVAFVLCVTAAYAVLCGREPSILRAAAMAGVLLIGTYGGRPRDLPTAMLLVAAGLVLADPATVFTASFQLTFAAAAGAVAAVRLLEGSLPWKDVVWRKVWAQARVVLFRESRAIDGPLAPARPGYAALSGNLGKLGLRAALWALIATAGAWAMGAPILVVRFGGLALTGALANVVVVPASEATLLVGLPGALLALIHPLLAVPVLGVCRALLNLSLATNRLCAGLPLAYLGRLNMSSPVIVAWYAAVFATYLLLAAGRGWGRVVTGLGLAAAAAVLLLLAATPARPRAPSVTFLDVGEGLCAVLETPARQFVLFDCGSLDPDLAGPRAAEDVVLPYLHGRGCRVIDAMVVSHPDVDHFNAVPTLLQAGMVRQLIVSPRLVPEAVPQRQYAAMLALAKSLGVPVSKAFDGDELDLRGMTIRFLHPDHQPVESASPDNDNCLVAAAEADGQRVLLTADLQGAGQAALIDAVGPDGVRCSALQVPHHGRKSAFWPPFIEDTQPAVAVVPCGPWYGGGAPDRGFLDALAAAGARVLTTADAGAVTLDLTRRGLRCETYLHPAGR